MKMNRLIPWLGVAITLTATLVGVWTLAVRIDEFNERNPRDTPYFLPVGRMEFAYLDVPVTVTEVLEDEGEGELRVEYGDELATIPVGIPDPMDLPGLARHSDWLRVFFVGESESRTFEEFNEAVKKGEVEPRLVFVSRQLNPGVEDSTFGLEVDETSRERGETMRKRWTFGFLELLPGGGFRQWERRFPESQRSFERRRQAAILAGEPEPARDPDELAEESWEWYAALHVIPKGRAPSRSFVNDALANSGWAWPVTACGVLGLIGTLCWALAPSRIARWNEDEKVGASEPEQG